VLHRVRTWKQLLEFFRWQRVGFARALGALNPMLVLFDPFRVLGGALLRGGAKLPSVAILILRALALYRVQTWRKALESFGGICCIGFRHGSSCLSFFDGNGWALLELLAR